MKNNLLLSGMLFLVLAFSACKDKEPVETGVDFDITFNASYDGNQLEKNKGYMLGSTPIAFQRFRLYLSDITLLNGTEEVRISEIEYLDFTPDAGASNLSVSPKIVFKNVPEGMYDGIRIGYGVKPAFNAKQPSDFPSGSPLAVETDYWLGWKSYIFMVLDGKADPESDGSFNFGLSYHCGSDPVYTTFTFNQHIHVEKDHTGLNVTFDVRQLMMNNDGTEYDIMANPYTSSDADDTRVAEDVMSHFDRATTIVQ